MCLAASFPALLLLLGCLFRVSGAICPGCLENRIHLEWCSQYGQPIMSADAGQHSGEYDITSPHWQVASGVLSPMSSSAEQGLVDQVGSARNSTAKSSSSSQSSTCEQCGLQCKNKHGLAIHVARMHRDSKTKKQTTTHTTDSTSLSQQVVRMDPDRVATVAAQTLPSLTTDSTSTQATPSQPAQPTLDIKKIYNTRKVKGQNTEPIRIQKSSKEKSFACADLKPLVSLV